MPKRPQLHLIVSLKGTEHCRKGRLVIKRKTELGIHLLQTIDESRTQLRMPGKEDSKVTPPWLILTLSKILRCQLLKLL